MIDSGVWELDQANTITFVLVNAAYTEVAGLGGTYTLQISKNGGAFAGSAGTKSEISNGWYKYVSTAAEANTVGVVSIRVTGAGVIQQNLEYVVKKRTVSAVEYTYTVTDAGTGLPIEGVQVWFTTDILGNNVAWCGVTDTFGVARDSNDALPFLDPGTYYVWRQKSGYIFTNPDTEVVS